MFAFCGLLKEGSGEGGGEMSVLESGAAVAYCIQYEIT